LWKQPIPAAHATFKTTYTLPLYSHAKLTLDYPQARKNAEKNVRKKIARQSKNRRAGNSLRRSSMVKFLCGLWLLHFAFKSSCHHHLAKAS
jgi:hypothetical protein